MADQAALSHYLFPLGIQTLATELKRRMEILNRAGWENMGLDVAYMLHPNLRISVRDQQIPKTAYSMYTFIIHVNI